MTNQTCWISAVFATKQSSENIEKKDQNRIIVLSEKLK